MAWLGSNLASIKSQITNFTKEVLIEGSNEIQDPNEQLQLASNKIKEYEDTCNSQKIENERLNQELREYLERAEANEYQAKKISSQYRALLVTKEDEIEGLKTRLYEIDEQNKVALSKSKKATKHKASTLRQSAVIDQLTSGDEDVGDWSDWGDADPGARVRTASTSTSKSKPSSQDGAEDDAKAADNCSLLQLEVKALKERLSEEGEMRQRETSALESAMNNRLAQSLASNENELAELKRECDDLKEKLYNALKSEGLQLARINDLTVELEERDLKVRDLESENESYRAVLAEKTRDIIEFERLAELLQSNPDLETMTRELQMSRQSYEELEKEKDAISHQLNLVRERALSKHCVNFGCQASLQGTDDGAAAILEESNQLLDQAAHDKSVLMRDRDELLHQYNMVKDKLLEAENEINLLEGENGDLLDRYDDLRIQFDRLYADVSPGVDLSKIRYADGAEEERAEPLYYENEIYTNRQRPGEDVELVQIGVQTDPEIFLNPAAVAEAQDGCALLKANLVSCANQVRAEIGEFTTFRGRCEESCRALTQALVALGDRVCQENGSLGQRVAGLIATLATTRGERDALELENERYARQLEDLGQRFDLLNLTLSTLESEREDQIDALRSEIDGRSRTVKALETEVSLLKAENEKSKSNDGEGECASLRAEIDQLVEGGAHYQTTIQRLESIVAGLELERSGLVSRSAELLAHVDDLRRDAARDRLALQAAIDDGKDVSNLRRELEDRDGLMAGLEEKIGKERQDHDSALLASHQQCHRLEAQIGSLNVKVGVFEGYYQQLSSAHERFKLELSRLKALARPDPSLAAHWASKVDFIARSIDSLLSSQSPQTVDEGFWEDRVTSLETTVRELRLQADAHALEKAGLEASVARVKEDANLMLSSKDQQLRASLDGLERSQGEVAALKIVHLELEAKYGQAAEKSREFEALSLEFTKLRLENDQITTAHQNTLAECERIRRTLGDQSLQLEREKDLNRQLDRWVKALETELEEGRRLLGSIVSPAKETSNSASQTDPLEREVNRETDSELSFKERELRLSRELDRLKAHLVKMEESYTSEALAAEEREAELRQSLSAYRERAESLASELAKYGSQNEGKVKNLSENLAQITAQRDKFFAQNASLQDDVCRLQSQITNLQLVLERVQKEKDDAISFEVRAVMDKVGEKEKVIGDLKRTAEQNEAELKRLGTLGKSYSFLNQRLAERESALNEARLQLIDHEATITGLRDKIGEMEAKQGTAFEKEIFKNLFMSYHLSTPNEKKSEIGLLMAKVLNFSHVEIEKMNLDGGSSNSGNRWGFGLWGFSPSKPQDKLSKKVDEKGLSELFIQFLERESGPKSLPKFNLPPVVDGHRIDPFETETTAEVGPALPLQQQPHGTANGVPAKANPPPSITTTLNSRENLINT